MIRSALALGLTALLLFLCVVVAEGQSQPSLSPAATQQGSVADLERPRLLIGSSAPRVGESPQPLGMSNLSLGGWSWRWTIGPDGTWSWQWRSYAMCTGNPYMVDWPMVVGLLVRSWGRITLLDPANGCFYIDDGSHLTNYARTRTGVRVMLDPAGFVEGMLVAVSGVATGYPDETAGDILPMLRPRRPSDVQVMSTP